jgi:hypothetical protein
VKLGYEPSEFDALKLELHGLGLPALSEYSNLSLHVVHIIMQVEARQRTGGSYRVYEFPFHRF